MTKEEAIKVLGQVRQWTDYPKEAFTMAIDALRRYTGDDYFIPAIVVLNDLIDKLNSL